MVVENIVKAFKILEADEERGHEAIKSRYDLTRNKLISNYLESGGDLKILENVLPKETYIQKWAREKEEALKNQSI